MTSAPGARPISIHRPGPTGFLRQGVFTRLVPNVIVFAAYFIAAEIGLYSPLLTGNIAFLWPAAGVALAAVLLWGNQVWLGIAAATFLANYINPHQQLAPLAALGLACGNTLAALAGGFLLRKVFHFDMSLSRVQDVLVLIFVAAAGSSMISASIGVPVLCAAHMQPWSSFVYDWLRYWVGDSTGVLLVTPVALTLPDLVQVRFKGRGIELTTLLLLLTVVCFFIFDVRAPVKIKTDVLAFAVFPFVIWAAIRCGVSGAAFATILIAIIATTEVKLGSGPFAVRRSFSEAPLLQLFFAVISISGLTLAAAIAERERAESEREELIRRQSWNEAQLDAMRKSEERFRLVANATPVMIWAAGLDKMCTYLNQRWLDFTRRPLETELGEGWVYGIHPDDRSRVMETYSQAFERHEEYTVEYRLRRHDGEYRWILGSGVPMFDPGGSFAGYIGSAVDVTPHKVAEQTLKSVSARLIEVQERERSRIARDLHDDINQRLALLAIEIDQLRQNADGAANLSARLGELLQHTYEISSGIHSLSYELHSSKFEELGVMVGMKSFCADFAKQHQVEINFSSSEFHPRQVPRDVTLCLIRVLQEALHNAVKHSGVRRFQVELRGSARELQLTVRDAGRGFDPEAVSKGLGLTSMRERIALVNGTISIDSAARRGTAIHARVSLHDGTTGERAA